MSACGYLAPFEEKESFSSCLFDPSFTKHYHIQYLYYIKGIFFIIQRIKFNFSKNHKSIFKISQVALRLVVVRTVASPKEI